MSCSANLGSQKLRKNGSPSTGKMVGPLRATLPVSLMSQVAVDMGTKSSANSGGQVSSPRVKASPRTSPTTKSASIQGSNVNKNRQSPWRIGQWSPIPKVEEAGPDEATRVPLGCPAIRRTASLDAIYLKGQWPREGFLRHGSQLLVDKSTQTPEEWQEERRIALRSMEASPSRAESRQKQRLSVPSLNFSAARSIAVSTNTDIAGTGTDDNLLSESVRGVSRSRAIPVPCRPGENQTPRVRNSVEGFSTEIEKLVWKGCSEIGSRNVREPTPDGHRAPIAELFKGSLFRSVNTQTPAANSTASSGSSTPSRSPSPFVLGVLDPATGSTGASGTVMSDEYQGSVLGTSPHVSRFLSREPPDGCEKVPLKAVEDSRRTSGEVDISSYCPLKPSNQFVLQSSSSSAFCPLYKPTTSKSSSSSHLYSTAAHAVIGESTDRSSSVPPEWPSSSVQSSLPSFTE